MTKIVNCHMTELLLFVNIQHFIINYGVVNDDVMMMIQWKDIF